MEVNMKYVLTVKSKRYLSTLLAIAVIVSLMAGFGGTFAADPPNPGTINVTKTEMSGETVLENGRTTRSVNYGSSTTIGNKGPDGKYYVASGHFVYAHINIAALKASPNGIDLDMVNGNDFNKCGTANVKIDGSNLVFTINNFSSSQSKNWGLSIYYPGETVLTHQGGSGFQHEYSDGSISFPLRQPVNYEYINIYFHTSASAVNNDIYEEATGFTFQIVDAATNQGVPLHKENITFRCLAANDKNLNNTGADQVVVNGGGIGDTQGVYKESDPNGYFWLINGMTASISNLPEGNYKIIEKYSEAHVTDVNVPAPNTSGKEGQNTVANISVGPNGVVNTEFVNTIETHELKITKTVVGYVDPAGFTVRVTFEGPGASGIKPAEGSQAFTAISPGVWEGRLIDEADNYVTFVNIPKGTTYRIEEPGLLYNYDATTVPANFLSEKITENLEVELVNTYKAASRLDLGITKSVQYRTFDRSFDFALYKTDSGGSVANNAVPVSTVTVTPATSTDIHIFDEIGIKEPGTTYYLIKETSPDSNGWKADTTQYHIKVDATATPTSLEGGPGLTVTYRSRTGSASWGSWNDYDQSLLAPPESFTPFTFLNSYIPTSADLQISGRKSVDYAHGNTGDRTTFRFVIEEVGGSRTSSASYSYTGSGTGGTFTFARLTFGSARATPYEFTAYEETLASPGLWIQNTAPITFYVKVTDNGRGALEAFAYKDYACTTPLSTNDLTFSNTFNAPEPTIKPASRSLRITKSVSGSGRPSTPFTFGVYMADAGGNVTPAGAEPIQTITITPGASGNSASANTNFNLDFTAAGTYYFLIKETSASGNGWTADAKEFLVRVTTTVSSNQVSASTPQFISRTNAASAWPADRNYASVGNSSISFANAYKFVAGEAALTITGRKAVNPGAPAETFEWTVSDNTDRYIASAVRTGAGEFNFTLNYVEADISPASSKIFEYTISEDTMDGAWTQYTQPITFYVKVTLNASTHAMEAYAYRDAACVTSPLVTDDLYFFNEYTESDFDFGIVKFVSAINGEPTGTENPATSPTVKGGDAVTYTIRLTNTGTETAYVDVITDEIPAGLSFSSTGNAGWTYNSETRTATITISPELELVPGESAEYKILLTVDRDVASGSMFRNFVSAHAHNFDRTRDKTPRDNADVRTERDDDNGGYGGGGDEDEDIDPTPDPTPSPEPTPTPTPGPEPGPTPPGPEPGGRPRPEPGGRDRDVQPVPTIIGNSLVPTDEGLFVEFDEDGVPLGEWRWDDPLEMWVFDEYPPLGGWEDADLPQTGAPVFISVYLLLVGLTLIGVGIVVLPNRSYKPKHLKPRR